MVVDLLPSYAAASGRPARLALLAIWLLYNVPAVAMTRAVGPGKQYAAPCAAIAAAQPGDVIEIDASVVYRGDVCGWTTSGLTLRGVGGRARIEADGRYAWGKGIWVIAGDNTTVEDIEFTGAAVPDHNGAGIRLDGKGLTVHNCHFHHNENGILAGSGGEILIEYSEFGYNGYQDGQSHNVYINHTGKLIFRFNYSHNSIVGHLLKSRAAENHILHNRLSGESGSGSYELDIPNGGRTFVIGNIIEQGPLSQNGAMVTYQIEGTSPSNPSDEIWIVNNTLVNRRTGTARTLLLPPGFAGTVHMVNNLFSGDGFVTPEEGVIQEANLHADPAGFVDAGALDMRLLEAAAAVNAGVEPGYAGSFSLTPGAAYYHPACGSVRVQIDAIDTGAYELMGGSAPVPWPGQPERCPILTPDPKVPAELVSPQPGATLPGGSMAFRWSGGLRVFGYSLMIGSAAGAADIYFG